MPRSALQVLQSVEGKAGAVLEQSHHGPGAGIVLVLSDPLGGLGGEDLPTEIAAQFLKLIDLGLKRRCADDPDQHSGGGGLVELAFRAVRGRGP